jgi:hypothetical protein
MPKVLVDDSKGLYQTSGKGVVGLTQAKSVTSSWSSGASIASGAISIPAGSLITNIHAVVSTSLTGAAGAVNIKAGTAAAGDELVDSTQLGANLAGAVAGKGQSTNSEISVALAAAAPIVVKPGTAYRSSDTDVHITVTDAAGNLTAGAVKFVVEFITFA